MCTTCGCGETEVRMTTVGEAAALPGTADFRGPHPHGHPGAPGHPDEHPGEHQEHLDRTHTLDLEQAVLAKNDHLAEHNRSWLRDRRITAVNLMSSPGSGKTTLLERTIREAGRPVSVIEGDQETVFDAERIRAAGARAVQVNTGAGCHLDAGMVGGALDRLRPPEGSLLFVENVGNLVCPALFDLGEHRKVVVISVTEGDDKPLKYPHMFAAADLVVVNKTDLLPYVDFDVDRLAADARRVNPAVQVLPVSARTGGRLETWYAWLAALRPEGDSDSGRQV